MAEKGEHDDAINNSNQIAGILPGPPHEALFLVLPYLQVLELFAMSEVCKSLRDTVSMDVLPWLHVRVERPLSFKLSDENLIRITRKAQGKLRTLTLMNSAKITDDGLLQVVKKNPFITELHVPGCSSLTPEGIIQAVKILHRDKQSLKTLSIHGINNLKKQHLEALCTYISLQLRNQQQQMERPFLYHEYKNSPPFGRTKLHRIIDVNICPRCNEIGMVFDCPREECQEKSNHHNICRGCINCIPRCGECGFCIKFGEIEEAACADTLWSECWLKLPKCNFCNKPYCNQHAILQCFDDTKGFICAVCDDKYIKNFITW